MTHRPTLAGKPRWVRWLFRACVLAALIGLRHLLREVVSPLQAVLAGEAIGLPFEVRRLRRLTRAFRAARSAGLSRGDGLRLGFREMLPAGLREVMDFELRVWAAAIRLLRWRKLRHTVGERIAYGSSERALWWVLAALGLCEGIFLSYLLRNEARLGFILAALHELGTYYVIGLAASFTCYPHTVQGDTLVLRHTAEWHLDVPLNQIRSVSWRFDAKKQHQQGVFALPVGGATNIVMHLATPIEVPGLRGSSTQTVSEIRFAADSRSAFDTLRGAIA